MTVRTRFAPSPTGYLHVGGVRTALFAYLVARQAGGDFILRFEDTDKKREVQGSREHLINVLRTLGLDYSEGPDIGGDNGPYVQSERLDIYRTWAQRLIDAGRAYADPYSSAEVQAFREQAQAAKKAFLYRDHRPENPPAWDGTTPLRFKSDPKSYTYHDAVMGERSSGPEVIDDFILIKSDGYPTYNFAHIVDDTEMAITHVIRGQEFISSMPNYLNLYEALGFDMTRLIAHRVANDNRQSDGYSAFPAEVEQGEQQLAVRPNARGLMGGDGDEAADRAGDTNLPLPIFAHLPHIMNETGNKKLGKRDGAKDVLDYVRDGYLPETLVSFIATMGWNDGTEQEVFSADELVEKFSLDRVQRSGARFDEKRLLWMNGQFIRDLSLDELEQRAEVFWPNAARSADPQYRRDVLALAQDRMKTLADLPTLTSYFFTEPEPNMELITGNKQLKKQSESERTDLLIQVKTAFENIDNWTAESIQVCLNQLLETTGQKPGMLFSLIRVVTTWAPFSPELDKTLALLGRKTTIRRIGTIDHN